MKNILRKVTFILVILILLFSINTKTFAFSGIIDSGKSFIELGEQGEDLTPIDQNGLRNLSGYLYNILLAAGVVIAVIVATVLGVQFMLGGAEGQAKVKEMLIPFVVGCIIVFGGFGFWKIAITLGQKIEETSADVPRVETTHEDTPTVYTTTYTKDSDGDYYCDNCNNKLDNLTGKCSSCGRILEGVNFY